MLKIYQGVKEIREKIKPIVPAVDGIIIKKAASKPHTAAAFEKSELLNMSMEIQKRAIPLRT